MHFLNENIWLYIEKSLKIIPEGPVDTIFSIDLDNGLVPTRGQAIIWTKWRLVYWRINASLVLKESNHYVGIARAMDFKQLDITVVRVC